MVTGIFRGLTLNYKHTAVDIRERVTLSEDESICFLAKAKETLNPSELLILSTCNRTEIYYTSPENLDIEFIKLLSLQKNIDFTLVFSNFISTGNQNETIKHLFRVALGLESQVVGDLQIINQVKKAYQWTADKELAGPLLHRLLHSVFYSNKRVVQETAFRDGAASVSYAAVELINQLASSIKEPKILVLGLGVMGIDICDNLRDSELKNVTIANRTKDKALTLAKKTGFNYSDLDNLPSLISNHDIIISSISANSPIITNELIQQIDLYSHKFFIDVSVPRSIEKNIDNNIGIVLYNIDEIQNRATKALKKRIESIPQVEVIVTESIGEFSDWSREFEVSPTIQKFKNALETIRKEEINRHLKDLDVKDLEKIELITKNITQKIIKLPVLQLKAACKRGDAENLIDVLTDLFKLSQEELS